MNKECYQKPEMIHFSTWLTNTVRGATCLGGHCIGDDIPEPCDFTDENVPTWTGDDHP